MFNLRSLNINLVSLGAAGVFLVLALIEMAGVSITAVPSAIFLFSAAIAAVGGFLTRRLLLEEVRSFDRVQAEREMMGVRLLEQQAAVDVLADGLDIGLFICDSKGNIEYANRAAIDLFRFPEATGRTILAVTLSYDLQNLVLDCVNLGEKQMRELNFSYPEERTGVCEVWMESGGERLFVSVLDITELRRLERVRKDFVANVSHELRTPLAAIRAMAETIIDEGDEAEAKDRYLPRIINEVDRLCLVADDLLSLTTVESNPVVKQVCNLAEVFRSAVQQLERKAAAKSLSLTYSGPESCFIEANSLQMSQVAMNLIDNGINYTNYGAVSVTLQPVGDKVKVAVQDTGIGISSAHVARIFERFYRVDKGRSRATGGTGLGLSIVRHIVEVHGGSISVDSSLNQGSTFTIVFPVGNLEHQ